MIEMDIFSHSGGGLTPLGSSVSEFPLVVIFYSLV